MSEVTAYNGRLIVGDPDDVPTEEEEKPNEVTQSVIDWLEDEE